MDLVLDNNPSRSKGNTKDKRWEKRLEAYNLALDSKNDWYDMKTGNYDKWLKQMVISATCIGFFQFG
ncbi:hypothetical protein [Anaeromicropila populeti]|uniref:Uncharacterized protein n=1 Tax=Anaeromicropila populeti TaxID=37658 RepID=A0A1I6K9S7_9FIRM|nr:hypothetical protein [Anaeromicropila populeti]SFR87640.1 hypothetical protein SAMN05661086_02287 [Anaeromicropila populeti]